MAQPALHYFRLVMTLVLIVPLGLVQTSWGQDSLPEAATGSSLPDQEQRPLGGVPAASEAGQDVSTTASSYVPDLMELVRVGGALAGVVALLFGLRTVLRRMGGMPSGRRPAGVVHIHARYPIARGQQVVLMQVGQRIIVAHQGAGSMQTLSEITDPNEVARLRGSLQATEGPETRSTEGVEFQKEMLKATANQRVVDLTRPDSTSSEPSEPSAPRRLRLPGWRGLS